MYAGSTLRQLRTLDSWFGAHQKIDRLAYKRLQASIPKDWIDRFPESKQILQFEGIDGPDGIKRKTPAQDEPWHFFDPYDETDTQMRSEIKHYSALLVKALRQGNTSKASYASAWLAHAVTDGLTPAHHYPYEEELIRLRGGKSIETRTTPKEKILMPGDTFKKKLRNNWQMWGDKGLLATHLAFEIGVAVVIVPLKKSNRAIDAHVLDAVTSLDGLEKYFQAKAVSVADLKIYELFYERGWTPKLARLVRTQLIPQIIEAVAVSWYACLYHAFEEAA